MTRRLPETLMNGRVTAMRVEQWLQRKLHDWFRTSENSAGKLRLHGALPIRTRTRQERRSGALQRQLQDDCGSVIVLTVLSLVVVFGFAALAVDMGVLMSQQQRIQVAADAGALAGASTILQGAQGAASVAIQYAQKNDPNAQFTAHADTTSNTVQVDGTQTTALWFARVLGIQRGTIAASSQAEIGTMDSGVGMVPLAVTNQVFQYGQTVYLSDGAGDGSSGNYGFLDLSGQGSNGLEYDLAHGFDFPLSVGEQLRTMTGVMTGPVKQAIDERMSEAGNDSDCNSMATAQDDCPRVMFIPIVNTLAVSGTANVTIIGFAAFYLDGLTNSGGHQQIVGQFLHMVTKGSLGAATDYGTYAVKLIQ